MNAVVRSLKDQALFTWEDLIARWRIEGPTKRAVREKLYRRCQAWGLRPMTGTRGDEALFRPADVLKAEARAAGERGAR